MDYPELRFIIFLALVLTDSLSAGLLFLLSRAKVPVFAWYASLVYLGLSILASLYIGTLFLQLMPPGYNLRLGLAALLIAAIAAEITFLVRGRPFTPLAYRLMYAVFILSTLASFLLAYSLFRNMVPV